jgi:hypothetical protein
MRFSSCLGEGFLCFGAVHIDTMDEFTNLSNNVAMCLVILGLKTKKITSDKKRLYMPLFLVVGSRSTPTHTGAKYTGNMKRINALLFYVL